MKLCMTMGHGTKEIGKVVNKQELVSSTVREMDQCIRVAGVMDRFDEFILECLASGRVTNGIQQKHGIGKLHVKGNIEYVGEWNHGVRSSSGTYKLQDGLMFVTRASNTAVILTDYLVLKVSGCQQVNVKANSSGPMVIFMKEQLRMVKSVVTDC